MLKKRAVQIKDYHLHLWRFELEWVLNYAAYISVFCILLDKYYTFFFFFILFKHANNQLYILHHHIFKKLIWWNFWKTKIYISKRIKKSNYNREIKSIKKLFKDYLYNMELLLHVGWWSQYFSLQVEKPVGIYQIHIMIN